MAVIASKGNELLINFPSFLANFKPSVPPNVHDLLK